MKPKSGICVLQIRHGYEFGIHVLILRLNIFRELLFFISCGTSSQMLGARYEIVSVPLLTDLMLLELSLFHPRSLFSIFGCKYF